MNLHAIVTIRAEKHFIVNNPHKQYMAHTSVLTLVHRRQRHLENLIIGLNHATQPPSELVVVYMNEPEGYPLPTTPYPIRTVHVSSATTPIPLARARNAAVAHAAHDLLVFLDVDCIPEADMLAQYFQASTQFSGLMMGDVFYLPPHTTEQPWTYEQLRGQAVRHPNRPTIRRSVQRENHYELFWTLNFALPRRVFEQVGGLDEHYQGYGAEDTDLAFTARQLRIPFALCAARSYHQHHPVYRPPLQHFADIISNARYFYKKWQRWPMEGWLREFRNLGLIHWDEAEASLGVLRYPTEAELIQAYHEAPAGF